MEFKAQVEAAGKAAEAKAKETEARHEETRKEIEQDYQERLDSLHRKYADSLRHASTSNVSKPTDTSRRVDEAATHSDPYLVEQCAETTLQLVELQKWIRRTHK
jgi:Na+/phosphate symporter